MVRVSGLAALASSLLSATSSVSVELPSRREAHGSVALGSEHGSGLLRREADAAVVDARNVVAGKNAPEATTLCSSTVGTDATDQPCICGTSGQETCKTGEYCIVTAEYETCGKHAICFPRDGSRRIDNGPCTCKAKTCHERHACKEAENLCVLFPTPPPTPEPATTTQALQETTDSSSTEAATTTAAEVSSTEAATTTAEVSSTEAATTTAEGEMDQSTTEAASSSSTTTTGEMDLSSTTEAASTTTTSSSSTTTTGKGGKGNKTANETDDYDDDEADEDED